MKKLILLAMAVMALAALAIPAAASANWTKNGKAITAAATVGFDGEAEFNSFLASVSCTQATASLTATAGTTDGHVTSFTVDEPTVNCEVGGLVGEICGETSLHSVELLKNATAVVAGGDVTISEVELLNQFGDTENPCLVLVLTDDEGLTAVPDNNAAIEEVTLSGGLEAGEFGTVEVNGTLNVSPPGVYGIE